MSADFTTLQLQLLRQRFERLQAAVKAYNDALRLHGAMSSGPWVGGVPALDELWDAVLDAAGIEHD